MRGLPGREKERGQKPLEIRNIKKKLGKGKHWQELEVQCSTRPAPPTVGGGFKRSAHSAVPPYMLRGLASWMIRKRIEKSQLLAAQTIKNRDLEVP